MNTQLMLAYLTIPTLSNLAENRERYVKVTRLMISLFPEQINFERMFKSGNEEQGINATSVCQPIRQVRQEKN